MYFELIDYETNEVCGLIKVIDVNPNNDPTEEIIESWTEFNKNEEFEHDDFTDVDTFVEFHNRNRVTIIERIFVEKVRPN